MLGKFLFTGFTAVALTCVGMTAVAQAPAQESILQKVQRTKVIKAGYIPYPPFVLVDPNTKKLSGYFIELMDAIVDNMGQGIKIGVVDDGPGIEPDDLDRAFERFYLWERYGVDRPVGSGLGLAIVAELATAMGGRTTIESTPGEGSVFTLELEPAPVPDHRAYARLTQR